MLADAIVGQMTMVQLLQQKTVNTKTRLGVSISVHFTQNLINLQHNKNATALICKQITSLMSSVVLIQEPWVNKNKILELRTKDSTLFCGCNEDVSRTCVITKGMLPFVYLSLVVRTKLLYVLILKTLIKSIL